MQFSFSQDQIQMAASLRDVLKKECTPGVVRAAWTSDTGHSPALWKTLAEFGALGLLIPEANGGLGMNELDAVLLFEEYGRAAVPAPIVETAAVAAPLLHDLGQTDLLGAIASGDAIVAVSLEHSLAQHVQYAHIASVALLRRNDEIHAVPRAALGLEPRASVDGSRRLFDVTWHASDATLIARGGKAITATNTAFDRAALATSAILCGLARQMIDMTVDYVKVRKQFGSPIGSFQAVKHHLASALVKLEFARPVVHRAAYSMARNDAACSMHVSMAKACASDAAALCARAALQCHGAIGYTVEHDLHMWMKRAWALGASYGDAAFHRQRVGHALFEGVSSEGLGGRS